jgi:ACS family glucarate transporter-like MFS transporter
VARPEERKFLQFASQRFGSRQRPYTQKAAQSLSLDYEYGWRGHAARMLVAGDEKKEGRSASMRTTHRRYWVFFLLFLFSAIAYLDRVNMSVAGKPIAHEFGLSPIALGYLFSSFLWAYVLMMLPGGRLIDRWGPHVVASVATAVWSAQMATGMVGSFAAMLMVRLGLGVGEASFAPISYSSVRIWPPYTERGTAIAAISCGSTLGLALGAPAVAWLIETLSWRWSFIITGAVGFVWVAVLGGTGLDT